MDRDDLMNDLDEDEDDVAINDAVLTRIAGIISDVLHVPRAEIGLENRAADIEGWDSLGHVRIVLAIDAAFHIRLSMEAIARANSVEGLVEAVEEALAERPGAEP